MKNQSIRSAREQSVRPWQKAKSVRLGFKLGVQRPAPNWEGGGAVLGWAVVGKQPRVTAEGELSNLPDPADELIRLYREESAKRPGCEGVTLYRYGSKDSFAKSVAAHEGSTHAQHNAMIDRAKDRLDAACIDCLIEIV